MKKLLITVEGKKYEVLVENQSESCSQISTTVSIPVVPAPVAVVPQSVPVSPSSESKEGIPSPLAGKVVAINVAVGQSVNQGDKLITLEAMKMNTFVTAPESGKVSKILISVGDAVVEGQSLVTFD